MVHLNQANAVKKNLIAGLVVFLVAVPLCLGIALASNAPLFSGLLAGIIGGIVVGSLSQSQVSVSGPAAGLIAVVLAANHELGGFSGFLMALTLAGLIQIVIGQLKAGFVADYVPSSVIQGLLCAIGLLIIIKQIPFALGFFSKNVFLLEALKEAQENLDLTPLFALKDTINIGALFISAISLFLLFRWQKINNKYLKNLPGPVVVVVLGVAFNFMFKHFFPLYHLSSSNYLVTLPTIESLFDVKHLLNYPSFAVLSSYKVYFYAFLLAAVASIETLLNLEAAEKLDTKKRYCSRDRELIAQGIGNTLSGLLGGLPITSVVVRSSVNVQSGSTSKLSAILHGIFLLAAILIIPHWINTIPLASLAAILIFVGFKLSQPKIFKGMYQKGLACFIPFVTTVVMIIASNLLAGILCGLAVSALWIIKNHSKACFDKQVEVYPCSRVERVKLPQHATFLNKAALIKALRDLPKGSQVILDGSQCHYIDQDIIEVIQDFSANLSREKNIALRLEGFSDRFKFEKRKDFLNVTTKDVQLLLDPNEVLTILKEGNTRFINNTPLNRDLPLQIELTSDEQHPMAVVLSCIDSRVPVERVFDVGVGDLFVTRVAGNVVSPDVIASIEFACVVSGAKLIIVMGHTGCGAIKAACDGVKMGTISQLANKIQPAIDKVNKQNLTTLSKEAFYHHVTKENVTIAKNALMTNSELLNELLTTKKIALVGALYDVKTGKVLFDESQSNHTGVNNRHESELVSA